MTEPWHHVVREFDTIDELNEWLAEFSGYEQDGSIIIKKIWTSGTGAGHGYYVWWLSDK